MVTIGNETPYHWLLHNSFSKHSLQRNIDRLVAQGIIDEGDAVDYFRSLRPYMDDMQRRWA